MSTSSINMPPDTFLVSCAKATLKQTLLHLLATFSSVRQHATDHCRSPYYYLSRRVLHRAMASMRGRRQSTDSWGLSRSLLHCSSFSVNTPEPLVPPKYLQVTAAADAAPSLPYSPRFQHQGPRRHTPPG